MDYKLLFLIVMALPIGLVLVATAYMGFDQDRRATYIVQLLPGMPLEQVIVEHRKRFGIAVEQSWSSDVAPGYRAVIKRRKVPKLHADGRIASILETD